MGADPLRQWRVANSVHAIESVRRLCDEELDGAAELEIIDVHQQPALVVRDQIVAIPTLVSRLPGRCAASSATCPTPGGSDSNSTLARLTAVTDNPARTSNAMVSQPIAGTADAGHRRPARPGGQGRDLDAELTEVRAQLRESQETIEAIKGGEVDSLVIGAPGHEQVFALTSADHPYRLIVEAMSEGAATVSPRGVILEANPCLAAMTGRDAGQLLGTASDLALSRAAPPSTGCWRSKPGTVPGASWSSSARMTPRFRSSCR